MHYNKDGTFLTKQEFLKMKDSFELKNEKKEQGRRMKLWGWQKLPSKIKHWEEVNGFISIPSGLRGFWEFKDLYGEIGIVNHPEINNPYKGNELDLKQDKVIGELLEKNIGYGHITTGVGKTMITAKIIKAKSVKTLIVVSGIELMNQMKADLEEIFGEKYPTIHGSTGIVKQILIRNEALEAGIEKGLELIKNATNKFRAKKITKKVKELKDQREYREEINYKKLGKIMKSNIVIVNIDTLVALPKEEFFKQFDLTVMDEVDTFLGADRRIDTVWKNINSKYIYGVTGTIKVNYVSDKIFDIYLGPKSSLILKQFSPKILKVMSNFEYTLIDMKKYHELKEAVYMDESRNNLIINTVVKTLGKNKGILFSEYIHHAKILKEKLENKGIKCFMLIGEIKTKERLEIKKQLKEYQGACVLIGSVKIIGRGFNIPELSVGYLTTVEKFKSNIEQYVGRIIRTHPGKEKCTWYDFIDPGCKILFNQSTQRSRTYKKEYPLSSIEFYHSDSEQGQMNI